MNAARKTAIFFLLMTLFMIFLFCAPSSSLADVLSSVPETERVENAIKVIQELVGIPDGGIPARILRKCSGLAIIPGVVKAAYGIGGQYGKGILLMRDEGKNWTHPVFISLYGGSIGWQIGVQKADIILVFKTRKTVENIARGKLTLGADVSVSAGPVGRTAEANTDLELEAEILSYSRSRGLFAGVSVKGASIQIDKEANRIFYNKEDVTVQEIFSGEKIKAPAIVEKLKEVLSQYAKFISV